MRRDAGATLIEMVVSIVIISVAVTSVMMVIFQTAGTSSDPLVRTQAIAIAESYMEEILSQPLTDPAGADSGGFEAGEVRATYDDVTDYHNLSDNAGAVDQQGNSLTGLEGYNVTATVVDTTLNGNPAKRILVVVTHDGNASFSFPLAAYRLN